jgi:hypothetical protein
MLFGFSPECCSPSARNRVRVAPEYAIETKEMKRLAELVRGAADEGLEKVSHISIEPAAEKLEKAHPELAARLWRAQGMRIVNAAKSKYYHAALSNFERARHCYERAGLAAEWADTVRHVRASHRHKTGFMSGFEAMAAGAVRGRPAFVSGTRQDTLGRGARERRLKKGNPGSVAAQGRRGGHSALVPRRHGGTERRLREFLVLQIPPQTAARVQRAERSAPAPRSGS